jgi:MoaA/NifB/PqqE/SkfB family radical SAM enzyme
MILTNGVLLSESRLAKLQRFSSLNFQISFDGPDEPSHDFFRGNGSFRSSVLGAEQAIKFGFKVAFLAVLSKRTSSQIPLFFELAKKIGVKQMNFTRLIVNGYAEKLVTSGEDAPLNPRELRRALQDIVISSARSGVRTTTSSPLMSLLDPSLGRSGRFWEGLVINHTGKILASSRSRIEIGDAITDSLETVLLKNPIFQAIRRGEVKVCGSCSHFNRCGGDRNAAYAESGDYLGPDPGCWISN